MIRAQLAAAAAVLGARLREPSTWAALGALALAAGAQLPPGFEQHAATLCGIVGALAGVLLPEKPPPR